MSGDTCKTVTLGSGTLTAEQVREAIEEAEAELLESCEYVGTMWERKGDVIEAFDKLKQAIADELNTRAERTHVPVFDGKWFRCPACNESLAMFGVRTRNMEGGKVVREIAEPIRFCPWCGERLVDA